MALPDLVLERPPPPNRRGRHTGDFERHLTEGAVAVAYAMHLFREEGASAVAIHPDGEHAKIFDFRRWLAAQGFAFERPLGATSYGGVYVDAAGRALTLRPRSGLGDVVCDLPSGPLVAECKGGCLNTTHPGQRSRLYKGLCEAVGLLLAARSGGRQVAVAPFTDVTRRLAQRLAPRCALAGIEIALVAERGEVIDPTKAIVGST